MSLSVRHVNNLVKYQTNFGNDNVEKGHETVSTNPEPKKSGLSNTAKYMIGATALAGTVAFGIIGHKSNWWRKAAAQTSELNESSPEVITELKQMTLDKFKEIGAFVKGKAKLTNGEMYSGTITKQNKDGSTVIIEYENGVLKKSTISYKGNFRTPQTKEYKYDQNGNLIQAGKAKFSYHTDTGKIAKSEFNVFGNTRTILCDKNGRVKYIDRYDIPQMNAGVTDRATVEFDTVTGKPKRAYMWDSHAINYYDKNGNPTHRIESAAGFSKKDILEYGRKADQAGNLELKIIDYNDSDYSLVFKKFWNNLTDEIYPKINITSNKTGADFYFKKSKGNLRINGILKNGHEFNLSQDGDIANMTLHSLDAKKTCAKYNIKTQELEILPEFTESAAEIKEAFNEITSAAQDAKRIIRNTNKYNKEKNEFLDDLRKVGL